MFLSPPQPSLPQLLNLVWRFSDPLSDCQVPLFHDRSILAFYLAIAHPIHVTYARTISNCGSLSISEVSMENLSPKYQAWVQTTRENLPPLNSTYTLLVIIATICITTRILSGTRSRVKEYAPGQGRDIRQLPYWIPYIGNAISLGLGSVDFLLKARFVSLQFVVAFYPALTDTQEILGQ